MSDAAVLYERHDELKERVSAMRETLDAICKEFGECPESEAMERRLSAIDRQLVLLERRIEELDQIEIDKRTGEPVSEHENTEVLIAEIEKAIPPIEEEVADTQLKLTQWVADITRGQHDEDDGDYAD